MILGFPWMVSYGKLDDEYGFIAMDLLGQNSLEVLRKLEQKKSTERYYGFPLASIVSIAVKLVNPLLIDFIFSLD
jgi:hypothetical protein